MPRAGGGEEDPGHVGMEVEQEVGARGEVVHATVVGHAIVGGVETEPAPHELARPLDKSRRRGAPVEVRIVDGIGDEMAGDLEAHASRLGGEAVEARARSGVGDEGGPAELRGDPLEIHDALLALPEAGLQLGKETLRPAAGRHHHLGSPMRRRPRAHGHAARHGLDGGITPRGKLHAPLRKAAARHAIGGAQKPASSSEAASPRAKLRLLGAGRPRRASGSWPRRVGR